MIARFRPLLFASVVGFSALVGSVAAGAAVGAAPAQDFATTTPVVTSTTEVASTSSAATTEATPTTIAADDPADRPLFTESRKIMAIIGALVFVAFCLLLLTIRYWRVTRPVPGAFPDDPSLDVDDMTPYERAVLGARMQAAIDGSTTAAGLHGLDAPVASAPISAETSSAGADHARSDDDWLPRGTGEHSRIDIDAPRAARPGASARRKALDLPVDT